MGWAMGGQRGRGGTRLHGAVAVAVAVLALSAGGQAAAAPGGEGDGADEPANPATGTGADQASTATADDPEPSAVPASGPQAFRFVFSPEPAPIPAGAATLPVDPQVPVVVVTGNCYVPGELRWWLRAIEDPAVPPVTGSAVLGPDGTFQTSIPTDGLIGAWGILLSCPYDGSGMPTISDSRTYLFGGGTLPTVRIGASPEDPAAVTAAVSGCRPIGEGVAVLQAWWSPMTSVEVPTVDGSASVTAPAAETVDPYAVCLEVADGYRQRLRIWASEEGQTPTPDPPAGHPSLGTPVTVLVTGGIASSEDQTSWGPRFTPIRRTEVRGTTIADTGAATLPFTAAGVVLLSAGIVATRTSRRRVADVVSSLSVNRHPA